MAGELWQLCDPQGRAIEGAGATKDEVFQKGLLHGAAHVWIWRAGQKNPEVLLQKRAADKRTWPSLYDISAAGHIDLGESPLTAALRETQEEIGLSIDETDLLFFSVQRMQIKTNGGAIENEFQWLYLYELKTDDNLALEQAEVSSVLWMPLPDFQQATTGSADGYVPHGDLYYATVCSAIADAAVKAA